MALGNNDISTNLVKTIIGESINSVGGLVTSENVNRWGINSPHPPQQLKYWGNFTPDAPHELGMFRGYDHNWRCFGAYDAALEDELSWYAAGDVSFILEFFPSWSTLGTTITHTFDVYMSRTGSAFTNPLTYTKILENTTIDNDGTLTLTIDPNSPPDDGMTPLPEGANIYLKVKHISSPDRRFDVRTFESSINMVADENDPDAWIITVPIGTDPFTYDITIGRDMSGSLIVSKYSGGNGISFDIVFTNGYPVIKDAGYVTVEINNQADFYGLKSASFTVDLGSGNIPAGTYTTLGGLVKGTLNSNATEFLSLTAWTLGENFYGRVSMDGGSTWYTGFNGTVVNTQILV